MKSTERLRRLRESAPAVLARVVEMCDGHNIIDPEALIEAGLDEGLVRGLSQHHYSDGTPKGTLFNERGEPLLFVSGVYGLSLLSDIGSALKLEYPDVLGRGYQARAIKEAFRQRFQGVID
jgi:hypothetical protein